MTGRRSPYSQGYWAGYERGVQAGHAAGYVEGVAVLDDAAQALAGLRPSKTVEVAAARQRMRERSGPSLTPREIRVQAAESWGLPVPADLADPIDQSTDQSTDRAAVVAELADDDDWAWQL